MKEADKPTPEDIANRARDNKMNKVYASPEWRAAQDEVEKHMHAADRSSGDEREKNLALKAEAISSRDALIEGLV